MLVAFVIASKHHVRAEWGTDYEDLQALLPRAFLERFQRSGFGYGSLEAARPQASNTTLQPKASASSLGTIPEDPSIRPNGHSTGDETSPLLVQGSEFDEQTLVHSLKGRPTLPLPLVIAHRLQLYLASAPTCIQFLEQNEQLTSNAAHRQNVRPRACSSRSAQLATTR